MMYHLSLLEWSFEMLNHFYMMLVNSSASHFSIRPVINRFLAIISNNWVFNPRYRHIYITPSVDSDSACPVGALGCYGRIFAKTGTTLGFISGNLHVFLASYGFVAGGTIDHMYILPYYILK